MRSPTISLRLLITLAALTPLGCSLESTLPEEPEIQVIEEVDFAPSLGIDLTTMLKVGGGVYYKDIVVGEGDPLVAGDQPRVRYTGWLSDGTRFDSGEIGFLMGANQVILGFEQGIDGMRLGGVRLLIIPPALGYGIQQAGNVPGGSVLVFEVEVLEIAR